MNYLPKSRVQYNNIIIIIANVIFVPEHPVINPDLNFARKQEESFDFSLLDTAINDVLVIDLNDDSSNLDEYL